MAAAEEVVVVEEEVEATSLPAEEVVVVVVVTSPAAAMIGETFRHLTTARPEYRTPTMTLHPRRRRTILATDLFRSDLSNRPSPPCRVGNRRDCLF